MWRVPLAQFQTKVQSLTITCKHLCAQRVVYWTYFRSHVAAYVHGIGSTTYVPRSTVARVGKCMYSVKAGDLQGDPAPTLKPKGVVCITLLHA